MTIKSTLLLIKSATNYPIVIAFGEPPFDHDIASL
jgi:hypothetical protein